MAGQRAKRKLIRRPGWARAAEYLGVTYSHLRRVLCGERPGASLRRRFRDWKRQQRAARQTTAIKPQLPAAVLQAAGKFLGLVIAQDTGEGEIEKAEDRPPHEQRR